MDKSKVIESASKLIVKGQFEKAVKEYQRVLEVDPDDVRVLQKLAELYQKMKKQSEAADCFEKVARTYAAQGFYLKAVALYKQVLKVVERVEVNVRLAELYQQLGLIGDATKEWQTVAAHHEKTGDHKASLDALKKLVDLDPDNIASRIRLGEQYARQENPVEAVAELRRAAQYLQRNGRTDDYLRVAERISHLDQSDTALARELAEHFLSRGDSKRALSKLQICFKANPRDLNTLQMLAKAFQDLGQTSKTVSVLKELGRVHADSGRADEARRTYAQAAELAPDDADIRAGLQSVASIRPAPATARPAPPIAPKPRTAPVAQGAGATTRHAQLSSAPLKPPPPARVAEPPSSSSIPKLLKETDVYIKYGLHDKAQGHLRRILAGDPDHLDARERVKSIAL
ncbi:MAG: tetratricopeptide repeat protein, partial [Myxococcales bacterium]